RTDCSAGRRSYASHPRYDLVCQQCAIRVGVLPDHPKWMHPHVSYPNALPVQAIMERLTQACSSSLQEFWPDDVSLLDGGMVDPGRIHGPRQLSDIYLLALAIRRKGRFVT